jgi:hypothetical protein
MLYRESIEPPSFKNPGYRPDSSWVISITCFPVKMAAVTKNLMKEMSLNSQYFCFEI